MKSNEVETTLKHPESFHGNVKNLSKRMKMKMRGCVRKMNCQQGVSGK